MPFYRLECYNKCEQQDRQTSIHSVEDVAAKILKVNVRTVTNLIRSGELEGVKVGRVWRIRESDL